MSKGVVIEEEAYFNVIFVIFLKPLYLLQCGQ